MTQLLGVEGLGKGVQKEMEKLLDTKKGGKSLYAQMCPNHRGTPITPALFPNPKQGE